MFSPPFFISIPSLFAVRFTPWKPSALIRIIVKKHIGILCVVREKQPRRKDVRERTRERKGEEEAAGCDGLTEWKLLVRRRQDFLSA